MVASHLLPVCVDPRIRSVLLTSSTEIPESGPSLSFLAVCHFGRRFGFTLKEKKTGASCFFGFQASASILDAFSVSGREGKGKKAVRLLCICSLTPGWHDCAYKGKSVPALSLVRGFFAGAVQTFTSCITSSETTASCCRGVLRTHPATSSAVSSRQSRPPGAWRFSLTTGSPHRAS